MNDIALAPAVIEYPSSDGKPMAETPVHYACMVYVTEALKYRYRDRPDVYVAANMLHYYEEGNPRSSVAPDVFVVFGACKDEHREGGWRDTYKVWEEPKAPDFVLEVTSRSTRREDFGKKRSLYASLRVGEYFLHDPRGEYLEPALQGYRLAGGAYRPIPNTWCANAMGVHSDLLGLHLHMVDGRLRLRDPNSGEDLLAYDEVMTARKEAERRVAEEMAARREVERRATHETAVRWETVGNVTGEAATLQALEAENAELKRQLRALRAPSADPEQ